MFAAAQNCYGRLDDKGIRTWRYIERQCGASTRDLTTAFSALNRILQVCGTEVEKANATMWGPVTVSDLVNHVWDYIAGATTTRRPMEVECLSRGWRRAGVAMVAGR